MRPLDLAFGGGERKTRLVINLRGRSLCARPYPGHPKGCPNFNKKEGCPPGAKLINKVLNLTKPVWLVFNVFPFGAHVFDLRKKHPDWSERQLACCLYWQGKARKQLRARVARFLLPRPNMRVLYVPEAHGVNVTKTMAKHGLILQWPPKDYACQVTVAGSPLTVVVNKRYSAFDIDISRPRKWGNPFRIGPDGDRDEVCDKHEAWLLTQPQLLADLEELRGRRLGCWCKPKRCHGDTYVRFLEQGIPWKRVRRRKK